MKYPRLSGVRHLALFTAGFASALVGNAGPLGPDQPRQLLAPPETETATTITLMWDKPESYADIVDYLVCCDGREIAETTQTHFTAQGLIPDQRHAWTVAARDAQGRLSHPSEALAVSTRPMSARLDIRAYGAKGDGRTKDTAAIQRAIAACPAGGTVLVPTGVFLTGALFLKSEMTLEIAAGGVLQGSTDWADYEPMIRNRFEGWEMDTYASLVNAGRLDHAGPPNVHGVAIRGEGTISGGGRALAQAEIAAHGLRSRGRLFCIMNCSGLDIQGLTVEQSSSWTIHYIYSEKVSCHDLTIRSTVQNGDGIDPDSSRDSFIFN